MNMKEEMRKELYRLLVERFEHKTGIIEENNSDYRSLLHNVLIENKNEKLESLLSLNREDIYWFIWNELMESVDEETIDSALLLELAENRIRQKNRYYQDQDPINVNEAFYTERLLIRPLVESDEFDFHGEEDELGWKYTVRQFNKANTLLFSIIEKDTLELVGFIGLREAFSILDIPCENVYSIVYYTKGNYRRKGYMKEALTAIAGKALSGNLVIMSESDNEFMLEKTSFKCDTVKISCKEKNITSQNVAKSAGFKLEGIINTGGAIPKHMVLFSLSRGDDI